MSDIAICIHTDDGEIHDIDAPADIKVQECVKELVSGLHLSATDRTGHAIDRCVVDKSTDSTKSAVAIVTSSPASREDSSS